MNLMEYEWIQKEKEETRRMFIGATLAGLVSTMIWALIIFFVAGCNKEAVAAHDAKEMIRNFEGFSASIYICPGGAQTIGYGFNLSDPTAARLVPDDIRRGERLITREEAEQILDALYQRAIEDVEAVVGLEVFIGLADHQRDILIDMAYQLGRTRLSTFKDFKAALVAGDIDRAVEEMRDSRWYGQSGRRSKHHVENFGGDK